MSMVTSEDTCNKCFKYRGNVSRGSCRARPPTATSSGACLFPRVIGTVDWCFEFKPINHSLKKRTAKKPKSKTASTMKVVSPPLPPKIK